jgi:hypothetical protein
MLPPVPVGTATADQLAEVAWLDNDCTGVNQGLRW